ncbi:MAG: polyprenyl synthetase family protein [Candidatus Bipolaricaulia bacterium]
MDLEAHFAERRTWVNDFLERGLAERDSSPIATLQEAMLYALRGGKRVRAILVMEAAELGGLAPQHALPTAAAIECFHAYSLVHDDLPAMDDDAERRGQPTVHVEHGEANAILVGDSLLPLGFELISREQRAYAGAERLINVVALFAETLGVNGLAGGQYLDLLESPPSTSNGEPWHEVHARKTARLIRAALVAGGTLAGLDGKALDELGAFGTHLGLSYQLVDDVLDWDEADGSARLSRFMGRDAARERIRRETDAATQALASFGNEADRLREMTTELATRQA